MEPFKLHVTSEVGKLKAVLLHRPGKELESLTPQYLDSMLFEDIPYLEQMQDEHDMFAQVLAEHGASIFYVETLLAEVLLDERLREEIIRYLIQSSHLLSSSLQSEIARYLQSLSAESLASCCIGGLLKTDVEDKVSHRSLSYYIRDAYPYYISPLPNLYFTRDPATVVGSCVAVNVMRTDARKRESYFVSLLATHHPLFSGSPIVSEYTDGRSIEGGDILMLGPHQAMIGCSARTEVWAIEAFAERMMRPTGSGGAGLTDLLVIQIPFTRAYMHLDTVFTMVDRDKFCMFGGIESALRVFRMRLGPKGRIDTSSQPNLREALKSTLGLPAVDIIQSGDNDPIVSVREQWNDSTNTLAIAPGTVVTYRRNIVSNETLERHGVTVIPIRGSELVRGRGGPRCMSMPLSREEP